MRSRPYKPVTGRSSGRSTILILLLILIALLGAFWGGRASVPGAGAVPGPSGVRFVAGIPVGFPATGRGAGDAAAAYLTVLGAAAVQPREQVRVLAQAMTGGQQQAALVESLLPSTTDATSTNVSQALVARVWVRQADAEVVLPDGASVTVKAYVCALSGPSTGGTLAGPDAGLAGGWYVQTLTVQSVTGQWRITAMERAVPAPPPDVRGTMRDGQGRDTQPLLEVLGPGSWAPGTS